jgi:hypothetical protein
MEEQTPGQEKLAHLARLAEILFREIKQAGVLTKTEQVELGSLLWELSAEAQKLLNPLKETLREEARKVLDGKTGAVDFKGSNGSSCRVTIPKTQIRLLKTAKIAALRDALGENFDECFGSEVKHVPKRGGLEEELKKGDQPTLLEAIEMFAPSPRVQFSGK